MVLAIILLVLLGLSMLVNLSQFAVGGGRGRGSGAISSRGRGGEVGPRLDEAVIEDNNADTKIAVVEVNGIITSTPIDQQGFSMVEVIKAQLDRAQEDRRVKAVIDFERREVRWSERERGELSETEAAVLCHLVANRKRAVSRDELLSRVWGIEPRGLETRTIDMHIARLRTKLRDPAGGKPLEAILTVRATGYMAGPDLMPLEKKAKAV